MPRSSHWRGRRYIRDADADSVATYLESQRAKECLVTVKQYNAALARVFEATASATGVPAAARRILRWVDPAGDRGWPFGSEFTPPDPTV